jgi:ribonuclease HI
MLEEVWLYTDGAARGNPGPAAAGYRILDAASEVLAEHEETLGGKTNNQAEYVALISGLDACLVFTRGRVRVGSDSKLVVNQMKGLWRVKHPELRPLHDAAQARTVGFPEVHFTYYPRSHPEIAQVDRALNELLDREERESSGRSAV